MDSESFIPERAMPNPRRSLFSLKSREGRALWFQVLVVAVLGGLVWLLLNNTLANMEARGIQSGFDFMNQPFGFDISETLVDYSFNSSYWVAFLIGLLNTLKVAVIGIVLATLWGGLLGIGRFSKNILVTKLCYGYVEFFRNVPLYLQLLIWYLIFTGIFPSLENAWNFLGVYLSKGGVAFPWPVWQTGQTLAVIGLLFGVAISVWYARRARKRFEKTGEPQSVGLFAIALIFGLSALGWLIGGMPTEVSRPEVGLFQIEGGVSLSPEFLTLLVGLVCYTSAFIAEIVRSGIASVSAGQIEAAQSLGLDHKKTIRLVVLPQALRVILPPLTSQYLNLTKNSSLAVAIGYPDLVSIANTSLNQTGRAIEALSIVMLVYLSLSLLTSAGMNWLNRRAAIMER